MPCASSSSIAPSRARRRLGVLVLGALVLALAAGGGVAPGPDHAGPRVESYRLDDPVPPAARKRLRNAAWLGGVYTASTGEPVHVLVSSGYPDGQAIGQRWADFLASLVHGNELGLATVYVVTPGDMRFFCGPQTLGCYWGNELVFMGETVSGVTPEEVARHEYGHHVAANRQNPPWLAVDWGPKRWASAANVCARQQRAEVFPGDEDAHYELNPGEGFAEVYRVLNETKAGLSPTWSLVDPSFSPDAAALAAAERDVVEPWSTPVTQVFRARFTQRGPAVWKMSISTPLDGNATVSLKFPRGALHELTVLTAGGRVLAKGLWSGGAEKRATATVCGHRSLVLRVARRGPSGRFTLSVTHD